MPNSSKTWADARRLALKQAQETTSAEAKRIEAGIAADPDTRELDDDWFSDAKPARGRPRLPAEQRKKLVTLRLPQKVIESYKSGGPGYQTRMVRDLSKLVAESVAIDRTSGKGAGRRAAKNAVRLVAKKSATKGAAKKSSKGVTRSAAKKSATRSRSASAKTPSSTRIRTGSKGRGPSR